MGDTLESGLLCLSAVQSIPVNLQIYRQGTALDKVRNYKSQAGADPGSSLGRRERLCSLSHITSAETNSLSVGVQGPLTGP